MKQTLYDILGVARDASLEVIVAAGRQRIAELEAAPPPDPNALPLVREAHQILSNPTRRSAYDASLAARAVRATAAPEADDDDPPDPTFGDVLLGGWRKWALGLVVLVALAVWWKAHTGTSPPRKPRGVIVQQIELGGSVDQPTSNAAAEPATTAAPAAPVAADPPASASPAEHIFAKVSASVARVNV
jgi:curved DNA-binding protein CbpA